MHGYDPAAWDSFFTAIAGAAAALVLVAPAQAQGAHYTAQFGCGSVTLTLAGFPDRPGNVVTEIITVDRGAKITKKLTFDGPSASDTIAWQLTPGHHQVDALVKWPGADGRGGHDQFLAHGIDCLAEAGFSIEKLQAAGKKGQFTTGLVFGTRREVVRYEIVVSNTGNVPLSLGPLQDARCDAGTIEGGPGGAPLAVGESTIYTCQHELTPADQALGSYENVAVITATPTVGDGPPITEESDPVMVQLPHDTVGFSCESMTFSFYDFPDAPGNTVTEYVSVDHVIVLTKTFVFDGPSGSDTITLDLPPGRHKTDGRAHWKTNGTHGAHDQSVGGRLLCVAAAE